jgi:hypothetical protein
MKMKHGTTTIQMLAVRLLGLNFNIDIKDGQHHSPESGKILGGYAFTFYRSAYIPLNSDRYTPCIVQLRGHKEGLSLGLPGVDDISCMTKNNCGSLDIWLVMGSIAKPARPGTRGPCAKIDAG